MLLAMSSAWCSSNSMCVAPVIFTFGLVVMISVWKWLATPVSDCMMHCTSTTIASMAPVRIASSWFRKLPADGMPWRIITSLEVQQMPARLMPLAPLLLAYSISSGSMHRGHDHLAEGGLVAVDDDVDLVVLQAAQVDLAHLGAGGAEQDVGDVGGPHRAAPAVGQRGADGGGEDVAGVLVVAHVRAVQDFDDLAVDAARGHALLLPDLLALGRRDREIAQLAALLAELADRLVGDVQGDLLDRAPLGRDAVLGRDRVQLGLIADFVALGLAHARRPAG